MALPIRRPCYIAGTPRSSGDVQTGELLTARGGGRTYTNYSGAAGTNAVIWSGAGRLNQLMMHVQMISGQAVYFQDSVSAQSGGNIANAPIVGILPPTYAAGAVSGTGYNSWTGLPMQVDMPFQSGLCFSSQSGSPGFTVSFTPEVNDNWANA